MQSRNGKLIVHPKKTMQIHCKVTQDSHNSQDCNIFMIKIIYKRQWFF